MTPSNYDPGRMMGCLFSLIACVFFAIAGLSGVTAYVARAAADGNASAIRGLSMRAGSSVVLGVIAILLSLFWYRRRP